jgi:hypothetical protein
MVIQPFDKEALREKIRASKPVPHFCIDDFLDPEFAERVYAEFPSLDQVKAVGKGFEAVNERGKIQVTDSTKFPPAVKQLHDALSSPEWLETLGYVMDIPSLQADPKLVGGGIHVTGPQGHLDVHVDFNYLKDRDLHRRLNILVYFNKDWKDEWGGFFELWDKEVTRCEAAFAPRFNRCCVFATSDISYHGVTAVTCPPDQMRRSFAAYYYTAEAPAHWDGQKHSTIFKARPNEKFKGKVLMPMERARKSLTQTIRRVKDKIRGRG